jgi:hypothetical protein
MSTIKVVTAVHPSSATNNLVLDSSGNVTVGAGLTAANTVVMGSSFLRNRIINGNMAIDQRNAGASLTIGAANTYSVDRWYIVSTAASKVSAQQNASAVTPPAGYKYYLGVTSLSAYSVAAGDAFAVVQAIEGYNIADWGFGAAGASTITLSFWVRASQTGTFGGSLYSNNASPYRSYPFTYTISSANTWEQKTVTITGDTGGVWNSTNGDGLQVRFGLGSGTTYTGGTLNTWQNGNYVQPTGSVSTVAVNGATFYVTGVQLEVGSVATPFERRLYGQELMLCQRYYELGGRGAGGAAYSTTYANMFFSYNVTKRTNPIMSLTTTSPVVGQWGVGSKTASGATITGSNIGLNGAYIQINGFSGFTSNVGLNLETDQCIALSAEL